MRPKRLISLLIAVCMMITMLPLSAVTAFAADTSTEQEAIVDGYKYAYTVNANGNATITDFRGPVDSTNNGPYVITIPTTLDKYTVTGIGKWAFYGCSALTEVIIPQSVTSIGKWAFDRSGLHTLTIEGPIESMGLAAFYECTKLETISFGENIKTIGEQAFQGCSSLTKVTIPDSVTSIGEEAFYKCTKLETISFGENIETIGRWAFTGCSALTNVTIPKNVTTIEFGTFKKCSKLEYIILPAGLTTFDDSLENCRPECVIYSNKDKVAVHKQFGDNLAGHKLLGLCHVTFDANGGKLNDSAEVPVYETEKIIGTKANELKAIHDPTRAGYKFTGWYTTADGKDGKLVYVDKTAIMEDITFYARWVPAPKAPVCHPLTLKDGVITSVTVPGKDGADPEDITEIVKKNANEDGSFNVPEGATVSVAFDKDAFADSGLKFGHWDITGLDDPNAYQNKESFDFEMPAKAVTLKAMTQDASIEDDEPDIVGPIVIGTTVVVGGAVLGYQAYSLGAEFAGKLMALPYFPSNRSALAMMLWEDAGKPMPESELLYPDVGQEERDMDLQHAARWAMENELIPDLNDEGTAPEEMKFFPANPVSKLDVLNAWQKAQELKNN